MKLYAVRMIHGKQAVGLFWVDDIDDLRRSVDSVTEPGHCEYVVLQKEAWICWPGNSPTFGVDVVVEKIDDHFDNLKVGTYWEGSIAPLIGDDVKGWTALDPFARLKEQFANCIEADPQALYDLGLEDFVVRLSKRTVYFVSDGTHIKIGHTVVDVARRLGGLSTGSSAQLTVLAIIKNAKITLERHLHSRFGTDHVRGEWFRQSPELLEFIEKLGRRDST